MKLPIDARPLAVAVVVCGALLTGCARSAAEKTAHAAPAADPMLITPIPEVTRVIEVGEAGVKPTTATLRVAARIEADETRMARIGAPVTGRITELLVNEGDMVKRGQTLAVIYSTELSAAQSTFLKAITQKQLAERAVARAKQLLTAGVIGEAEVQRREADWQQASADVSSSREQLSVLGLPSAAIEKLQATRIVSSTTQIVSTIDGIVLERHASIGQVVQAAETPFVIADLSLVWLVADVPEQSAAALQPGKSVTAEIPALPGEPVSGALAFVSSVVNRDTRTVRVRMNLPNPRRKFKPAMLATMTLKDGTEARLVVPTGAVVRENNTDYVFFETKPGTYQLRRVLLGDEFGTYRAVNEGVNAGDRIVVAGAFHLNNERNRQSLKSSEAQ